MQTLMIADDREMLMHMISRVMDEESGCFTVIPRSPEEIGRDMQVFPKVVHAVPNMEAAAVCLLRMFNIPPHTDGYRQLAEAIPLYARNRAQCFSKELYPVVAEKLGFTNGAAVEHSIRNAICSAWKRRDPAVWETYFPAGRKPPSNTHFISVLAELLE